VLQNLFLQGFAFIDPNYQQMHSPPTNMQDGALPNYESSMVWGLCGSVDFPFPDSPEKVSKAGSDADKGNQLDLGVSFEVTAGFWSKARYVV
jgi:hypothetical protein